MKTFNAISVIVAVAGLAMAQPVTVQTSRYPGMSVAEFSTPDGRIRVHLPESAGVFSGVVIGEPAGKSEKEKTANGAKLQGYVVEMEGRSATVAKGVLKAAMPAAGAVLILRGPNGEVTTASVAHRLGEWGLDPNFPEYYPLFNLMHPNRMVVQSGAPAAVDGHFDGNFETTQVRFAGEPAAMLLESQNGVVVLVPAGVKGPADLSITENGNTWSPPVQVVGISLSAPKTTLRKGERTDVTIHVDGLNGVETAQRVKVRNNTPGSIRMGSADTETIVIEPAQADAGGVWQTRRPVVGVAPGLFSLTADLEPPMYCAAPDCVKLREQLTELTTKITGKLAEITAKTDEAVKIVDLAAKARDGGPAEWDKRAEQHQAAANRKRKGSDAWKDEQGKIETAKTTAAELRAARVPDDSRDTIANETLDEAKRMDERVALLRDDVKRLKVEIVELKAELAKLNRALDDCLKKATK